MASEGPVVLSYHDTLLRQSDVELLKQGRWLNDNLIAFWFDHLEHELYADAADRLALISPQVAQFIKSAAETPAMAADVGPILESLNLSSKKLLLIPINDQESSSTTINGTHWSLLAYYKGNESFEHYDSFSGSVNRAHAEQIVTVIKPLLTHGHESDIELDLTEMPCTQQTNGYDCGMHLIMNSEAICRQVFRGNKQMLVDIASVAAIKQGRTQIIELIRKLKNLSH